MADSRDIYRPHVIGRPLVFGETLFDEFDDGTTRLGGAPLNVAWHLRAFGLDPVLVTRVGEDPLGGLAIERMRLVKLDTQGVQVDPKHVTGRAAITHLMEARRFAIPDQQAFDYIDAGELPSIPRPQLELLYHGSLAARHEPSASALHALRGLGLPTFVDVNLRSPWWDRPRVEALLAGARWLKLNTDELEALEDHARGRTLIDRAQRVRERFGLEAVIVTCGPEGAFAVTADDPVSAAAEHVVEAVDAVGAGDAFSAVVILGIIRAWSLPATLRRAVEFAAALCAMPGPVPEDASIYQTFLNRWRR